MKDTENRQVEPKREEQEAVGFETIEMLIDHDSVNVSIPRYDELIKNEVQMEMVKNVLTTTPSYNGSKAFDNLVAMFVPKEDKPDA